ncbi:hypothetical protein Cgig2_004075 [Carnegiea gigantea]|uniref:DNA-directed RNA polymerase III subunit RPC9 n=1 Tax=Carnegiea gigantea TaxID=171969 RepID=A0A9Q1KTX9_9CARY|nr:hypothetical protein Cgig2_004075 [Carnegiea gigantea]
MFCLHLFVTTFTSFYRSLKANAGPLTNFEVLDFLRSRGALNDPTRLMSSVAPSEFKVYDYLVKTPACNQTRENICEFIEKSKEYQLAKAEVLNIINIRPSSAVEIVPIIEEWEDRMEDTIEELAEMIVQLLRPGPLPSEESNAGEKPNVDGEPAMPDSAVATDEQANNGEEQMEES